MIPATQHKTDGVPTLPHSTIRRQLGEAGWEALHPAIRERFAAEPAQGESIRYVGAMQKIECSRAGWLFALLTRVIGNPLTPFRGQDVKMEVLLQKRPGKDGVFWRRSYFRAGHKPYVVTSVKREGARGEMLECVGGGFGMVLTLSVKDGALHFRSTRYFWQAGRVRVPLPHILSPGATHVVHEDIGSGNFRFTIRMDHPLLGRTFYQTGIFRGA